MLEEEGPPPTQGAYKAMVVGLCGVCVCGVGCECVWLWGVGCECESVCVMESRTRSLLQY